MSSNSCPEHDGSVKAKQKWFKRFFFTAAYTPDFVRHWKGMKCCAEWWRKLGKSYMSLSFRMSTMLDLIIANNDENTLVERKRSTLFQEQFSEVECLNGKVKSMEEDLRNNDDIEVARFGILHFVQQYNFANALEYVIGC